MEIAGAKGAPGLRVAREENAMGNSWRKALLGGAMAVAALLVGSPSSASTHAAFNGTFQNTSAVITDFRQADGNTFISETVHVVYAGDLSGSVVEQIDLVIHPNGSLNFNGVDICACTLAGRSGTVVFPFSGTGDASGASGGRFTIKGATGALADLHGVGTFQSSNGGSSGSFSGDYHFDP